MPDLDHLEHDSDDDAGLGHMPRKKKKKEAEKSRRAREREELRERALIAEGEWLTEENPCIWEGQVDDLRE